MFELCDDNRGLKMILSGTMFDIRVSSVDSIDVDGYNKQFK